MGVPTLGCRCAVCRSPDPRDQRTRASVLLSFCGRQVVIDTSPDFRLQALREGLERLDGVVLTHGHADHILGLDDIRPFNLTQQREIPVYGSAETLAIVRRTFAYIFEDQNAASTLPCIRLVPITGAFDPRSLLRTGSAALVDSGARAARPAARVGISFWPSRVFDGFQ